MVAFRKRVLAGPRPRRFKRQKTRSVRTELMRLKKQVNAARNVGFVDVAETTDTADTSGELTLLNAVAEGTDDSERLGNKITMTSLRYLVYAEPGTSQITWQNATWYLVYDRQTNGSLPTVTDVLAVDNSMSFPAWDGKDRFQILRKEKFLVAPFDEGGPPNQVREGYVKLNHLVNHDAASAAIGSIVTGGLFSLGVGNIAPGTDTAPVLNFTTRITFNQ